MNIPIEGFDVTEVTPINGVLHVGGIIRSPYDLISIRWEVDNKSGSTECEAWRGQFEINNLTRAGYKILTVGLHK